MFIVFEWVDGAGKDTQLNKTFEYLWEKNKDLEIWKTKEPNKRTTAWREILKKLKTKDIPWEEALTLFVQDREEQTQRREEIVKHSCILCSRFDYSTYVYQWLQGMSFEEVYAAHNYDRILIPDITFIFHLRKENIKKRLDTRGWESEFFEKIDFLEKANEKYLEVAKKLGAERKIFLVDANGTIDEVFEKVKKVLDKEWWEYEID